MNAPSNVIGHDAAASLLRLTPDQLSRLAGAGVVRRAGPGKYVPAHLIRDYIEHLHQEPDRRERAPTQEEIATHLDMSDRNVREVLTQLGMDHKEAGMSQVRVAYIRRLREQAAGRMSADGEGLDLVQERAALARSQREAQEMKNAVARGEFAPIGLLSDVLGAASAGVVDRFDQLDGTLRKVCPDLPEAARVAVHQVIASARNEWIRATASLVEAHLEQFDDDADEAEEADQTLGAEVVPE